MVVRTRVFESGWTTEHENPASVLWLFSSTLRSEQITGPAVVPQCNILGCPSGRAPTRGISVYFPDTRCGALTSSTLSQKALPIAAGIVVAAVASALLNRWLALKAERRNPPLGRFITVDGVRLHYVERGTGTPLILLHGNGSMIQDFQSSGLIDLAAKKYRVIAFDRPGFGHSERPRSRIWTPAAQADLIAAALEEIGVPSVHPLGGAELRRYGA